MSGKATATGGAAAGATGLALAGYPGEHGTVGLVATKTIAQGDTRQAGLKAVVAAGAIIYVGKAKNLRNRVRQYFHSDRASVFRTGDLIARIADVDLIVTDNEIEALALESNS